VTAERIRGAVSALRRLPAKLMLATMLVCVLTREWYPFSFFPMFATFGPPASYVCVSDGADRPLATMPALGFDSGPLARSLERRRLAKVSAGSADAEHAAAVDLLRFLVEQARPVADGGPLPDRLRLWRETLRLDGERIVRSRELLGEAETR